MLPGLSYIVVQGFVLKYILEWIYRYFPPKKVFTHWQKKIKEWNPFFLVWRRQIKRKPISINFKVTTFPWNPNNLADNSHEKFAAKKANIRYIYPVSPKQQNKSNWQFALKMSKNNRNQLMIFFSLSIYS
jgi:hypothetical protein